MQNETVKGSLTGNALIIDTAKKMWMKDRFRSFYRGLTMGLVGMFPYAAIDLGTFEYLKKTLVARRMKQTGCTREEAVPGNFALAITGGMSGAIGASAVYPVNLLRTRLQAQGTASHPRTYTGIVDVARQTIQGEGFRGLFKGLTPNLLKVIPAVSIVSCIFPLGDIINTDTFLSRPMLFTRIRKKHCICDDMDIKVFLWVYILQTWSTIL